MQVKKIGFILLISLWTAAAHSQTTYLPIGSKEASLLERLEIKTGGDSVLRFSKTKPYSRKAIIPRIEGMDSLLASAADKYNYFSLMAANGEWISGSHDRYSSKKPVWKHFYKTPANMIEVNKKDFFLAVNPVIQYVVAKERNNNQHLFLNSRGVAFRGRIAGKIGFAGYMTENQERTPQYVQQWVAQYKAVPGQGYFKEFKRTAYDYLDARGTISFNAIRYIDVSFGYDRNFWGNGQRSLFLSDFSNNMLFLKLNTRIWKFNYQNLFMELTHSDPVDPRNRDYLLGKKYAVMHHLDIGITKWLNVGLFESVVFGRKDHFAFSYLNPVIFLRSVELDNGSKDNAIAGLDVKANVARRFQFYGQLLLDEFKLSEIKNNRGWWANKWAWQLGAKYIDAFNIHNLDLQVEANRVRPFTYSHDDSLANYTHYNQPMAHPLGAGFQEVMGQIRYQPLPRFTLLAKAMYYFQGRDSSAASYGSNIFLPNVPPYRKMIYGFNVGSGLRTDVSLATLLFSYELKQALFVEASALFRTEKPEGGQKINATVFAAGIRWNMPRRTFDF
jgi:hypothetical protein